jgi:glycosyltransferase involved in cell wall biosynthesis
LSLRSPLTLYWFSQTIGARRGLEDVVRAMGQLTGCDIELHLRGNWQAGYQDQLFELASSLGVAANRIEDYSPAPADEMVSLAAGYDVGLALEPGTNQNNEIALSNKILTYLLAGNALIATATRAQEALVETVDKAGFCYEPGDVKTLAAQLKRWHDDRNLLEEARRQSWEYGATRYNWDVEKHKFLQVVKNVLQ